MRSLYASVCVVLYYYWHCDFYCYWGEIRAAIERRWGGSAGGGGSMRMEWIILPCEERLERLLMTDSLRQTETTSSQLI